MHTTKQQYLYRAFALNKRQEQVCAVFNCPLIRTNDAISFTIQLDSKDFSN